MYAVPIVGIVLRTCCRIFSKQCDMWLITCVSFELEFWTRGKLLVISADGQTQYWWHFYSGKSFSTIDANGEQLFLFSPCVCIEYPTEGFTKNGPCFRVYLSSSVTVWLPVCLCWVHYFAKQCRILCRLLVCVMLTYNYCLACTNVPSQERVLLVVSFTTHT